MKSRKMIRIVLLIAIFATAVMIFLFSAEDGEESAETSEGLTLAVLRVLVPDYDARPEDQQAAFQELAGHIVRKLGHFSEFALLGGLLLAYLYLRRTDGRFRLAAPAAWGIAFLYACTDEAHQMFVAGRGPSFGDVCIDASGAAAGIVAAVGIVLIIEHIAFGRKMNNE